jgi:hypothetical protein
LKFVENLKNELPHIFVEKEKVIELDIKKIKQEELPKIYS